MFNNLTKILKIVFEVYLSLTILLQGHYRTHNILKRVSQSIEAS
jgi:hypothetical protein